MRFFWFDLLKGIAILLVVGYHLIFDLDYVVGINLNLDAWYWSISALPVLAIFIGGAGVSLVLSRVRYSYKNFVRKNVKNSLCLLLVAVTISGITAFLFPDDIIVFGVLHLIAVSRLLAIPLVDYPKTAIACGLFILSCSPLLVRIPVENRLFVWLGCAPDNFSSLDYFPLFPWFGIFCIGISFGHVLLKKQRNGVIFTPVIGSGARFFAFLGRQTLIIYLVHQPVIFIVLWLCDFLRL